MKPLNTIIKSENITVNINYAGAEVSSIMNKDGLEYMWQAKKDIWPRHAPVLFPIVGKLKNNNYSFNGNNYELPQHGFARDMEFNLTENNGSSCTFELKSSETSKKNYPFDFVFSIQYTLRNNELITTYKTKNPSSENILFAVGAHPGFRCPLLQGEKFEDYFLEFESEKAEQTELSNGLRSKNKKTLEFPGKKLRLTATLFDNDALVFENSQINSVKLASDKSSHSIKFICKDWPYFGIWSKKSCTEFVCLEPWFGIADKEESSGQLENKDGMITLAPGKEFSCSYSVFFS